MPSNNSSFSLKQIDSTWSAVDQATLVFTVVNDRVLLIRKKRGLGAGKINGPGGKLEAAESTLDCAVREVQEELGVTIKNPQKRGELRFQFLDGYSIHVHVFLSVDFTGEPIETDEAIPLWYHTSQIPYPEMWADDAIWLPRVLLGEQVSGRFVFDSDQLLEHEVTFSD